MAGRSPLVHHVPWPPRVGLEVNHINATLRFAQVAYPGGSVVLEHDMNARPFVPEHFRAAIPGSRNGRRGSDSSHIQRDEQVEALLLADLTDDDARRPHTQRLLHQATQLDLAGALEIRLAALQRDDVRQRDPELEDLFRRDHAFASRDCRAETVGNVVLPAWVLPGQHTDAVGQSAAWRLGVHVGVFLRSPGREERSDDAVHLSVAAGPGGATAA